MATRAAAAVQLLLLLAAVASATENSVTLPPDEVAWEAYPECIKAGDTCYSVASNCSEAECDGGWRKLGECGPTCSSGWKESKDSRANWIRFIHGDGCEISPEGCLTTVGSKKYEAKPCGVRFNARNVLVNERGFDTESSYDTLTIRGFKYSGTTAPRSFKPKADDELIWRMDGSVEGKGWKLCTGCPAFATTNDDGNCQCIGGKENCYKVDTQARSVTKGCHDNKDDNTTFIPSCDTCRCFTDSAARSASHVQLIRGKTVLVCRLSLYVFMIAPLPLILYTANSVRAKEAAQSCERRVCLPLTQRRGVGWVCLAVVQGFMWYAANYWFWGVSEFIWFFMVAGLISAAVVWRWHYKSAQGRQISTAPEAAEAAEAQQPVPVEDMSCLGWKCCLCCICCCNWLGLCWPMHAMVQKGRPDAEPDKPEEEAIIEKKYHERAGNHLGDVTAWPTRVMLYLARLTTSGHDAAPSSPWLLLECLQSAFVLGYGTSLLLVVSLQSYSYLYHKVPVIIIPIVKDYRADLLLLPVLLALHYICIAMGAVTQWRISRTRFHDWIRQSVSPGSGDLETQTEANRALVPKADGEEESVAGWKVKKTAAIPSVADCVITTVAIAVAVFGSNSVLLSFAAYRYVAKENHRYETVFMDSWVMWHLNVTYMVTIVPLLGHRLLNAWLYAAECNLLRGKAEVTFTIVQDETDKNKIEGCLEAVEWKAQDLSEDWKLAMHTCVVMDLIGILSGLLVLVRLAMAFHDYTLAPLVMANCGTLLTFLFIQFRPLVAWNTFLINQRGDPRNDNPILFMWIERGQMEFTVFGQAISQKFFVATGASIATAIGTSLWSMVSKDVTTAFMS